MKNFKKLTALFLAVAVVFSLSACHPQDEAAITVKDKSTGTSVKLTTAQYLYALTSATVEAQSKIKEANSDKTITDYSKYKVTETDANGKKTNTKYYKWIENRADALVRSYAAVMIKKEDLKLKLDKTAESTAKSYADMYWQYYYQPIFEKNGISDKTYLKMFMESYYQDKYFLSIYDTKGTDPVAEKDAVSTFYDSYTLGNAIKISVKTDDSTADTSSSDTSKNSMKLSDAKKLLEGYQKRAKKGEKFETLLSEYNKTYNSTDQNASSDPATVFGSEDTNSASEYFTKVFKMKKGDTAILTNKAGDEIILVQKQNIKSDKSKYYANYRQQVLYQIKQEEFSANLEKYYKGLKVTFNESATNRISAEKIDVSTESQNAESSSSASGTASTAS